MPVGRLSNAFARAKAENRAALVAYVMAGDPSLEVCAAILDALPKAGVDVIELGFPFIKKDLLRSNSLSNLGHSKWSNYVQSERSKTFISDEIIKSSRHG